MRSYFSLLQSRFWLIAISLTIFPILALAQATIPVVVAGDPITEVVSLIGEMFQATGQWKALGWVAALAAVLRVLIKLTNTRVFDNLVGSRPWIKPAISSVLGVLIGIFGTLATGVSLPSAILAGLLAGLSSTGIHEVMSMFNKAKQAERAAGTKLGEILTAKDGEAAIMFNAAINDLNKIVLLPGEQRLAALAAWANGTPVTTVAPPATSPPPAP